MCFCLDSGKKKVARMKSQKKKKVPRKKVAKTNWKKDSEK